MVCNMCGSRALRRLSALFVVQDAWELKPVVFPWDPTKPEHTVRQGGCVWQRWEGRHCREGRGSVSWGCRGWTYWELRVQGDASCTAVMSVC